MANVNWSPTRELESNVANVNWNPTRELESNAGNVANVANVVGVQLK